MMNQESVTTSILMFLFRVLVACLIICTVVVDSQIIATPAPIATATATPATLAPGTLVPATLVPGTLAPAPTAIGTPLTIVPGPPVSTVGPAITPTLSTNSPALFPTLTTAAPAPTFLLPPPPSTPGPTAELVAPPTFSDGVTLQDCQWDLATSDINGDGIITQNEYPVFLDIFGRRFCNEPTGVTQCGAICLATWFQLTADIGTGISIPMSGLTSEQLLEVCSRTASSIPKSCPAPTFFPSPTNQPATNPANLLTTSAPGTTPTINTAMPGGAPIPFIPPIFPTLSPVLASEPVGVAPGVTAEDCHSDLLISDSDQNGFIDDVEYGTFMAFYGFRVCYTPTPETQTSRQIIYTRLLCATNVNDCDAATGIPYQPPLLTVDLLNLVCTETYKLGMLSSTCAPTPTATTSSPGVAPGASSPSVVGGTTGIPTITTNGTSTTMAPTITLEGNNTTSSNDTATTPPPTSSPVQQQQPSGSSDATRIIMMTSSSRTGLLILISAVAWLGL